MNFNCCESLNISSINFNCSRDSGEEMEFHLLKQSEKRFKFENLLPESENYLYFKILKSGKIISLEGEFLKLFKMKRKDIVDKNLEEVKTHREFFLDFIKPLFDISIKEGDSFQFMFSNTKSDEELVCSIYPCSIPGDHISSIDVVVRHPQNISTDLEKYKINNS